MIFGKAYPEDFTRKTVIRFAWVPTELSDGRWCWLQHYETTYEWRRNSGWKTDFSTIRAI